MKKNVLTHTNYILIIIAILFWFDTSDAQWTNNLAANTAVSTSSSRQYVIDIATDGLGGGFYTDKRFQ